ncbi:diguanylate cyclase [Paenibacillus tarimensis]
MGFTIWPDFILFLIVLFMFFYVFLFSVITNLHKVYLTFHFLVMLWPLCQFAVNTTDEPGYQLFYVTVSFVGMSLLGPGWLIFAVFLTGQSYTLTRKTVFFVFLPALVTALGAVVNPWGLFMRPLGGTYFEREYGPLFWFLCAALFFYFIVSTQHIIKTYRSGISPRHKKLIRTVMAGVLLLAFFTLTDVIVNVVLADRLPVVSGISSLGIALSVMNFVIAIRRYKVFNVTESVHLNIIDSLNTGIIVVDPYDYVIEFNQVIKPYIDIRVGDRLELESLLAPLQIEGDLDEFIAKYRKEPPEQARIEVVTGHPAHNHVAIYTSPIVDQHNDLIGRLLTFQDVSELRRLVEASYRHNDLLQERNRALIMMQDELFQAYQKLEHMAVTDSLTGCFNRRYLMQQLEHEVMTNARYNIPFAIILFDIDLFKSINDTYGHLVGDEVLQSTVEAVKKTLRKTDIIARYGGEEFTVYLPHTNRNQASMLAEKIKSEVEANRVMAGDRPVSITISMGVVAVENSGIQQINDMKSYLGELFAKADAALYEAKDGGRNRIVNTAQV